MEFIGLDILNIPCWVILSVLATVLLYWHGTATHNTFKKMGIPYRKAWPYLGNIPALFTRSIVEGDMEFAKNFPGRIAGNFQGKTPILESADVQFIKEVTIKEFPKFTNRRNIFAGEGSKIMKYQVVVLEGEHWKHVRSMITPTFTSGKLKQMYPVITNCADKFVTHLRSTQAAPMDMKIYASGYTMDVIASTAFGMDIDAQSSTTHPFIEHAGTFFGIPRKPNMLSKVTQAVTILCLLTLPPAVLKWLTPLGLSFVDKESVRYFYDIVDNILKDRTDNSYSRKDFISICSEKMVALESVDQNSVRTNEQGVEWTTKGLTKDEVSANATTFFSAGYETTATALQFFFYNMVVNPEIQESLYNSIQEFTEDGNISYEALQKLDYLDWCVWESLRIFPPVIRFDRVASEDVCIRGIQIPKGQIVNILPYAVHHDPEYWEDPEAFKPERFSPENKTEIQQYAWLPFGAGGRNCIAMRLALLEVKVAVVKLMTAFRFERTADTPEPAELKFKKFSGFLQPAKPFAMSAVPRDQQKV